MPLATWRAMWMARAIGSEPSRSSSVPKSSPSMYSYTMYGCPSRVALTSNTWATLGLAIVEAAIASRRKRASASRSAANIWCMILTA